MLRLSLISRRVTATASLSERFTHWNHAVFNGELPNIPVKMGRSKVWAGICRGVVDRKNGRGSVSVIEISDYVIDNPEVIDSILLHEMIHAYMFLRGKSGHGWEFELLRREISSKSGIAVKRDEDIANLKLPDSVKKKKYGVVIVQRFDGKNGGVVYNLNFFNKAIGNIKSYIENVVSMYRGNKKRVKYTFVMSDHSDLFKYPEKRSVMEGFYPMSNSMITQILDEGEVLMEVES